MKIKVLNPNKLPLIDYRDLHRLQGALKTLSKDNYKRLKYSLETKGFFIPFYVWQDKAHANKCWVIDGHQRLEVLITEKAQPYKLPYIKIPADNLHEAKEKLMIVTSQFGEITEAGLESYLDGMNTEFIKAAAAFDLLPNIFDDPAFKNVHFKAQDKETKPITEELILTLKFSQLQYQQVKAALANIDTTPEKALLKVLQL